MLGQQNFAPKQTYVQGLWLCRNCVALGTAKIPSCCMVATTQEIPSLRPKESGDQEIPSRRPTEIPYNCPLSTTTAARRIRLDHKKGELATRYGSCKFRLLDFQSETKPIPETCLVGALTLAFRPFWKGCLVLSTPMQFVERFLRICGC